MSLLNPFNLLGSLIFSTIGWGAWRYGRQLDRWKPVVIGLVLMVYPYLMTWVWELWAVGIGLCVLLWYHHDE